MISEVVFRDKVARKQHGMDQKQHGNNIKQHGLFPKTT
jgi:hypothetical protein